MSREQNNRKERAGFGIRESFEQYTSFKEQPIRKSYVDMIDTPKQRKNERYWNGHERWETPILQRRQQMENREMGPTKQRGNGLEKQRDDGQERQRENVHERKEQDISDPRPHSLHEAILTLKPLRQVRPRIPDMQGRY